MSSFRSRLFIFIIKNQHYLRFRFKRRSEITWDTSIPKLRADTEKSTGIFGKLPDGIEVEPVMIDSMYAEWIRPTDCSSKKALLYFHGGGYVIGSAKSHRGVVSKYVKGTGIPSLVIDYRLAPEHPFPAAHNDAITAYLWLLKQGIAETGIALGGDSAGGGLVLSALLGLKQRGIALPGAAFALSPWTDLKNSGESLKTNIAVDPLTWAESWTIFSHYYAKGSDPGNPLISPLYGDLHGLPPLLIFAGGDELLRDDSVRFAQKALEAKVDVKLRVGEGMFHCYPVCAPLFREATEAMDEICAFLTKHLI